MSKTLRYRLFKIGALPQALRAEIAPEKMLFQDEGVAVTVHRHGAAPGFRGGGIGMFSGAFAITDRRLVASISSTVVAEAPYADGGASGAEAMLDADGLHLNVDASIHPRCSGEIRMHFKHPFSAEDLARFPQTKIAFRFPVDLVPKMFGVPG
jgi:hypothetical protein